MVIESVKGAAMTYQGSASVAPVRSETQPKVEASQNTVPTEPMVRETVAMDAKQTANGQQQAMTEQQNAQIKKAVEDINKKANSSEAIFGIHEETNRVTIKIVDKQTKEVIKELPPEKTLDMIAKVWEMAGLMVDEKR